MRRRVIVARDERKTMSLTHEHKITLEKTARLQAELNDAMRYSGCPDGVPLSGWCAYLACIRRAAIACMEINDSGESYSHDNADGAQALANLFSALNSEPP